MFFKTATVACSLAALLMVGCENGENDLEENGDTIVTPTEDYTSPDETEPLETEPLDTEPADTTPPMDLEPTTPEPTGAIDEDEVEGDEPVVEEVEADSLPEEPTDE